MTSKIIENTIFYLFLFLPVSLLLGTLVSESSIILICLLFIYYSFNVKDFEWFKSQDCKILLILYFFLIINLIFSEDKSLSWPRNVGFIKYIIFIFAVKKIIIEKTNFFNKILLFWSAIFLLTVFDLYYEYIFGKNILGFQTKYPGRLVGFLGDENKIGTFITGFLFPITFFWFYKLFKKTNNKEIFLKKLLYFLFIILILYILLPIGQRANVIKLSFALLFVFYFFPFIGANKKIFLFLLSIFLVSLIVWNNENFKSRYIYQTFWIGKGEVKLIETYKKSHYWKHGYAAYLIFKNNPLFGVGNKNYRFVCKNFSDEVNKTSIIKNKTPPCVMHPHQIYYEFLSEHGILGLFFIIILTVLYLKKFSYFEINKNLYLLGSFAYFIYTFIPLIPSGSFFTSFNATLFWINYCFFYSKANTGVFEFKK